MLVLAAFVSEARSVISSFLVFKEHFSHTLSTQKLLHIAETLRHVLGCRATTGPSMLHKGKTMNNDVCGEPMCSRSVYVNKIYF